MASERRIDEPCARPAWRAAGRAPRRLLPSSCHCLQSADRAECLPGFRSALVFMEAAEASTAPAVENGEVEEVTYKLSELLKKEGE